MSEETAKTAENNPNKKRSRKKHKNFLLNAKKYAKKGQMGRGTKIPEELYQYFVGILDAIKQGIEDADEQQALVDNVLERTRGDELNIIGNQLGCRVIEMLLPYSSPERFEEFMEVLGPELRPMCSDNFSSHVVEMLLRVACDRATLHLQTEKDNLESEDDMPKKKHKKQDSESDVPRKKSKLALPDRKYTEEHIQKCYQFTLKICKYALNNLEDFVWDQYANHILRSALKSLSGISLLPGEKPKTTLFKLPVQSNKGLPPDKYLKIVYKIVPDEFKELVKEFVNRLSSWPQFKDLPFQNITSGLLQVLLYAVKNVDKHMTKDLITKMLDESFAPEGWVNNEDNDEKKDGKDDVEMLNDDDEIKGGADASTGNLPPVFTSEPAVRLLEAALYVAKKKMYTQLYARCFINRLGQLAALPMLNYTVQRLFDNCHIKEELEPMFDELSDKFGALLASGNTGVLVAVAKACLRVQARQAQFVTKLETALKCSDQAQQKYFSVCCLRLLPVDRVDVTKLDKEYFIHVHGSVILQTILDFQRPAKAVQGLLELSPDELVIILCDAKGCHVADALCKGQCVGVKARDKLIWKLKGYYQKLALSQYGSRAFEQVFHAASPEQKTKIMIELADKSSLLNSSQYGRLIASKLDVATFKLSQKNWEEMWQKKNKD